MIWYVAISLLLVMVHSDAGPSPLRVTIDCSSEEMESNGRSSYRSKPSRFDANYKVNSFCNLIHTAIPDAVKDGRFVVIEPDMDQAGFSDTITPIAIAPPKGFIPKYPQLKPPKLRVPKLNVPKLRPQKDSPFAPSVSSPKNFGFFRSFDDVSSAERMERFKKGVQKMLHVVKVLGQIDQYLSERTRIIVDKLSKTFAD